MEINIQECLEDILYECRLSRKQEKALDELLDLLGTVSYDELCKLVRAKVENRLKIFPCSLSGKVYYIAQVVKPGYPDPKIEPEMFLCDFKEEWADGYGEYVFLESEKDKAIKKLIELQSKNKK